MSRARPSDRFRVALVDPMCPKGYCPVDLRNGVLGGTEATVMRVSSALSDAVEFLHFQNARTDTDRGQAGALRPLRDLERMGKVDAVIVINSWKVALKLRKQHPEAPIFLWLHVFPGKHNRRMGGPLRDAGITVVCVSESHARWMRAFLGDGPTPRITHAHNPIADHLRPDATPRDRNLLLFASSPHKGLKEVFAHFDALRRDLPELTLAVADPGYLRWDTGPVPQGVIALGSLRHDAMIRAMRRSLCLFYPQTSFAETFGLVLAEANAVGTPVLAQRGLGANDEVVTGPGQLIECSKTAGVRDRIETWRDQFPEISTNAGFRLQAVRRRWLDLLARAERPAEAANQPEPA